MLSHVLPPVMQRGHNCQRNAILLFAFVVTLVVIRLIAYLATPLFQKPEIGGGIWILWQIPRLRYHTRLCLRKFRRSIVKEVSLLIVDAAFSIVEEAVVQDLGNDSGSMLRN